MADSLNLLKMLEPAVRPVGAPGAAAQGRVPFEGQSFESLLEAAQDATSQDPAAEEAAETRPPDPLGPLSGLGAIGNASLRELIGNRNGGV